MSYGFEWSLSSLVEKGKQVAGYTPGALAFSHLRDTRAWDTRKVVRTHGDFLALARHALADAGRKVPALKATFDVFAANPERVRDRQGNLLFAPGTPMPQLFARLRDTVAPSPATRKIVVAKAAEYHKSVELAVGAPASVPPPGALAPPSTAPTVPASPPAEPFYRAPWFAPAAALSALALAALVLLPRKS